MDFLNIQDDWEKQAPKLASIGNKNPFSLPEGYFDTLNFQLNSRLTIEEFGGKKEAFAVPQSYFIDLTEHIEAKIAIEELMEQTPEHGFAVPQNYFDTLQARINQQVAEPVKVISINKSRIPAWMNYAAAACVMIAMSTILYFNYQPYQLPIASTNSNKLSSVPEQEIIQYLQLHSDRGDMPVIVETVGTDLTASSMADEVSVEEMQDYLNNSL